MIDRSAVENLRLDISGKNPVELLFYHYDKVMDSKYDMHYPLELGFVIKGKMRRLYQNYERNLDKGHLWLCGIWEPHGWEIIEAPCEVLVFVIFPDMLAKMRYEEYPSFNWQAPFAVPPEKRPFGLPGGINVMKTILDSYPALSQKSELISLKLRVYLMELLLLLNESTKNPFASDSSTKTKTKYDRLNKVINLVFNSHKFISVEEAAEVCGLSRNIFSSHFKEVMGISFTKFGLRYRLQRIAERLLASNDSIEDIANEWDFTDKSHLSRRFFEHYGCSPGKYRKINRKK